MCLLKAVIYIVYAAHTVHVQPYALFTSVIQIYFVAKRTLTSDTTQAEDVGQSRPKRRAAKNISSGSYAEEDCIESPASDGEESNELGILKDMEMVKVAGTRSKRSRPKKFPKIRVKMIRGSEESTPIFLAQSVNEVCLITDCTVGAKEGVPFRTMNTIVS